MLHSEQSDDDGDSDDELPSLTLEERAARLAALVAPLPTAEWGQKDTPPTEATSTPIVPTPTPEITLPARAPKLTSNKYDGASSDESSDEEERVVEGEEGLGEDEGEDGPAVLEESEMDMHEEMDEFLKFATETLGLSEEQYGKILGERKSRGGAFPVPAFWDFVELTIGSAPAAFVPGPPKAKKVNVVPPPQAAATPKPAPPPPTVPRAPLRNPNLTDFDALMEQMDAELARSRAAPAPTPSTSSSPKHTFSKPAAKQSNHIVVDSDSDDGEDAEMGEMDEELAQLFKTVGGEGGREGGADGPVDYNLVKNFLESFQSQGGFAGPAGNLSGRLGFNLPRDETG